MLDNLSAVAANYVQAGFTTLVLDGVLETTDDRRQHAEAVAVPLTVCRLLADLEVVHRRLRGRHADDHEGLEWHLHRSGALAAIQDESAVEDLRLDVTGVAVKDAAARVLDLWHARDSRA